MPKKPLYTNDFMREKPLGINNFFKATDFVVGNLKDYLIRVS